MVLKELIGIERKTTPVAIIVETHHPTAQLVALHILISCLTIVGTTWEKSVPISVQPFPILYGLHCTMTIRKIRGTAKDTNHL